MTTVYNQESFNENNKKQKLYWNLTQIQVRKHTWISWWKFETKDGAQYCFSTCFSFVCLVFKLRWICFFYFCGLNYHIITCLLYTVFYLYLVNFLLTHFQFVCKYIPWKVCAIRFFSCTMTNKKNVTKNSMHSKIKSI